MHNIEISNKRKSSDKLFKRAVNESLSRNSYRVWLSAKVFEADDSSAIIPTYISSKAGQNPACWVLSTGNDSLLTHVFIKPKEWMDGMLTYKIHYSADVAGVGAFNVQTLISGVKGDELIPGTGGLISFTIPEPGTAFYNTIFTPSSDNHYFSIDPNDLNVAVYFGREGSAGGDPATSLLLYGIELIYRQGRVQVGVADQPHRL